MTKKTKRKIPLFKVKISPGSLYDYNAISTIPEIVQIVIDETILAIEEGIEKNKKSIFLFEIADTEFYIELKKDNWKSSLEKAIEYYVEKEDYNKCAECKKLLDKL